MISVKAPDLRALRQRATPPLILAAVAFAVLYWEPFVTLLRDWWSDPEAGHGLLLGPLAVWLAWKRGLVSKPRPAVISGVVILVGAVLLRYLSGLAAELFTLRLSMLMAAGALVVYLLGWGQVRRWWLPIALLLLSVPIPSVILNTLALPLQLQASAMGAHLLAMRNVPVLISGNVIHLPRQALFVTEACSGLRSLTALVSLGVLCGGLWLRTPVARILLLAIVLPVGIVVNGIRVFLTGFLVYFVDPALGKGFMHLTEGWALFLVSFTILGGATWLLSAAERWLRAHRRNGGAAPERRPEGDVREAVA